MRLHVLFLSFSLLNPTLVVADEPLGEAQAVQQLERLGATIQKDNTLPNMPVIVVDFQGTKVTDKDLSLLKSLPSLRCSDLATFPSLTPAFANCTI